MESISDCHLKPNLGSNNKLFQLIGIVTVVVWSLATGFILFNVLKATMGLRVSEQEETTGLDISEHGLQAYGS